MRKGVPNKRYTPDFKKLVVETMQKEHLSYCETAGRFEINDRKRVAAWERIFPTEGPKRLSMRRKENCVNNVVTANFFGLLQSGRLYLQGVSAHGPLQAVAR